MQIKWISIFILKKSIYQYKPILRSTNENPNYDLLVNFLSTLNA